MEGESITSIRRLIEFSKEIRKATAEKEKLTVVLQELNFFLNFSELFKKAEDAVEHLFNVTHQLTPGDGNEILLLTIKNTTIQFTFNPSYWSFSLQEESSGGTKLCSNWKLEKQFKPEDMESISTLIPTNAYLRMNKFKLSLIFSITFNEAKFHRIFQCGSIELDALHFLTPGRRVGITTAETNAPFPEAASKPFHQPMKFQFQVNENLRKEFLKILLKDAQGRGFDSETKEQCTGEVTFFIGSEEVGVEFEENRVILRTHSTTLLQAVKRAVLKRLGNSQQISLVPLSDSACEEMYQLKLELESWEGRVEESAIGFSELRETYLKLRKFTEGLEFRLASPSTPGVSHSNFKKQKANESLPSNPQQPEVIDLED